MSANAGFSSGAASYASREKQMAAYDRLPPSIRVALANAAFDWAPYPIRKWFESGRRTAKQLVGDVAKWDREQIAKDRKRVWGIVDQPAPQKAKGNQP